MDSLGWVIERNDLAGVMSSLQQDPELASRIFRERLVLTVAAYNGNAAIVSCLVDYGAPINQKHGEIKDTALHSACYKGHLDVVDLLLNRGAKPIASGDNWTPLMEVGVSERLTFTMPAPIIISFDHHRLSSS